MEKRVVFLVLSLALVMASFSSAEIFIGPTNPIYNYGDELNLPVTLIPNTNAAAHLIGNLICGEANSNIFNNYYNLVAGQEQQVNVGTSLTSVLSSNEAISCYISMSYGTETASSNSFTLSKSVSVEGNLDLQEYKPSGTANIVGTAIKESGSQVDGFVEITIGSLSAYKSASVIDGAINTNFQIPEKAKSGMHTVTIRVYDVDSSGKILNEGSISREFKVTQMLKELKISTSSEKIDSVNDLTFKAGIYDQSGELIKGGQDIKVTIYGPGDVVYQEKLVKSDEEQKISISQKEVPGYWKIEAKIGDLKQKKLFYVNEVKKVQTSLIDNTLIVTNIGNVPYQGPLEITVGSKVEVKQLDLKIGETQKYKLYAPEGSYQISTNDGSSPAVLGTSFLTGNAVKVVDVKEGFVGAIGSPIIWWLGIILLVLIIVFVQIKRRLVKGAGSQSLPQQNMMNFKPKPSTSSMAMPMPSIQQGEKESAAVIVIRAQAPQVPSVTDTMNKALSAATSSGAKVYIEGENKIILFSKRLTRQDNNELSAVKTAQTIDQILSNHNRMFKDKINYGIGVNDGEIISEIKEGHFKFTTLGSLISGAKRIAAALDQRVLLSDSMHRKVANIVTTEKAGQGDTWAITRVRDRAEYSEFLERFKKKM